MYILRLLRSKSKDFYEYFNEELVLVDELFLRIKEINVMYKVDYTRYIIFNS